MNRASVLSLLISLVSVACGGSTTSSTPAPSNESSSSKGLDAASTGSSLVDNERDSGTDAADGGARVVTITTQEFDVGPGQEIYKCQDFVDPFGGKDAEVVQWDSHMTAGSHHMIIFYESTNANAPIETCSGAEFSPGPYGTQSRDNTLTYPPHVATLIAANTGFRIQAHYLNPTAQTVHASVVVNMTLAEPGTITDHVGLISFVNPNISVPSQTTQTVTKTCSLGTAPINLIQAYGHMHEHTTHFVAQTNTGDTLFDTMQWSEPPPTNFTPPKLIAPTTSVTWSCTIKNDTSQALKFGLSATANEMCNFFGSYYPDTGGPVYCD